MLILLHLDKLLASCERTLCQNPRKMGPVPAVCLTTFFQQIHWELKCFIIFLVFHSQHFFTNWFPTTTRLHVTNPANCTQNHQLPNYHSGVFSPALKCYWWENQKNLWLTFNGGIHRNTTPSESLCCIQYNILPIKLLSYFIFLARVGPKLGTANILCH